ncbi:hypothetical protein GGTG_02428 [Gaeumannomyces tritici R3-111a-1]|uniref:Uncharacterized protein n=1 Tax=Gaeumannomyces tritici (strain R3-111a-1) TaxID=644352 RepID=J3NMC4_GAET3|nr:hypothetical protein GGTG_02428 [Gaeumannomyces tritici R3-111a-1]EJT82455.1 hypothetical protein GGTG_02428 [Gaeumannomyces tritici R3-111a-1]
MALTSSICVVGLVNRRMATPNASQRDSEVWIIWQCHWGRWGGLPIGSSSRISLAGSRPTCNQVQFDVAQKGYYSVGEPECLVDPCL